MLKWLKYTSSHLSEVEMSGISVWFSLHLLKIIKYTSKTNGNAKLMELDVVLWLARAAVYCVVVIGSVVFNYLNRNRLGQNTMTVLCLYFFCFLVACVLGNTWVFTKEISLYNLFKKKQKTHTSLCVCFLFCGSDYVINILTCMIQIVGHPGI